VRVGRFLKTPDERKQYTVDYTDWLAASEQITNLEFEIDPNNGELVIDGSLIDGTGKLITFFVSGGVDDKQYKIVVRVTTSSGQIKEDYILFTINEI
jgi:hypothetical protein